MIFSDIDEIMIYLYVLMQCVKRSLKDESISFAIVDFKQDIVLDMEMIY